MTDNYAQEIIDSRKAAEDITQNQARKALVEQARGSKADFMQRLLTKDKRRINNADGTFSTHLLGWDTDDKNNAIIFPRIQPDENGELKDFGKSALDRAVERGDTIVTTPELADWFTQHYKEYFPVEQ